jgi:hypothetical protein
VKGLFWEEALSLSSDRLMDDNDLSLQDMTARSVGLEKVDRRHSRY